MRKKRKIMFTRGYRTPSNFLTLSQSCEERSKSEEESPPLARAFVSAFPERTRQTSERSASRLEIGLPSPEALSAEAAMT